jgi:hypothetical protein
VAAGRRPRPFPYEFPVTVDLAEVLAAVRGAAGRVDGDVQVGAARGLAPAAVRFLPGEGGRDRRLVGQAGPVRVDQGGDVAGDARVEPGLADVRRVDREALAEREPRGLGQRGELVDVGPGALGVDVVGSERRDAAPVVDTGVEDQLVLVADEVRRGLDAGLRPEDEPGDSDGGG